MRNSQILKLGLVLLVLFVFALGLGVFPAQASAKQSPYNYAGMEFFGSPRITRAELEKSIGLKSGANLPVVERAVEKLTAALRQRHIDANVALVFTAPDKVFVAVDIPDSSLDPPFRQLKDLHHVDVRSDQPFLLLDSLAERKEELNKEGKSCVETYTNGAKYFSDEACNRIADHLLVIVPVMKDELFAVSTTDPDPKRRARAIELMNWAGDVPDTVYKLIPAIDDVDADVRSVTAKYDFARLKQLPIDFPFEELVDAFSRQLNRTSHDDREKALYCLLALATVHPDLIDHMKDVDDVRVKQLAQDSIIPAVKNAAEQLADKFSKPHMPFAPVN